MEDINVVVDIAASPERVWAEVSDHAGFKRFLGVMDARLERPGVAEPNGKGALRFINTGLIQFTEEITSFDPPRRYDYKIVKCNLPLEHHSGSVTLEATGEGTRVVWASRISVPVPLIGAPAAFMAKQGAQVGFRGILMAIKSRLEAEAPGPTPEPA